MMAPLNDPIKCWEGARSEKKHKHQEPRQKMSGVVWNAMERYSIYAIAFHTWSGS